MGRLPRFAPQHGHGECNAAAYEGEADKDPFDTSFGDMPRQQDGSEVEQYEADE